MASTKEYLDFVLEQLSGLDEISSRAMMGEFILYYRGKIFGGIYDDRLLVKPVPVAVKMMPDAEILYPKASDFNRVQFEAVRSEAGLSRFVMTPTKWIEQTKAIGIVSKAGRYGGGTYAHSDIAMAFATWISPEFQLYIMKDYRRLKQDENSRLSLDWNLNRALSKVNYRIHTDAVKENLIPPAKQWKNNNPSKKGNVRDDANLNQLLVLAIKQMDTLASINLSAVSALPGGDV